MTLADCIARLTARLKVDLESEIVLSSNDISTSHIQQAAREVARKTYGLYTVKLALTLSNNDQQIDLLGGVKTASRVFRCDAVYINGNWLEELRQQTFYDLCPDYLTATSTATPSYWTPIKDNTLLLDRPINTTGAAATNYVRGFLEHRNLTYSVDQALEMDGPDAYHLLYVNQAVLNLTLGTVSGTEAYQRRQMIQAELDKTVAAEKEKNLNEFRRLQKRALAGNTRRIGVISNYGY